LARQKLLLAKALLQNRKKRDFDRLRRFLKNRSFFEGFSQRKMNVNGAENEKNQQKFIAATSSRVNCKTCAKTKLSCQTSPKNLKAEDVKTTLSFETSFKN